MWIEDVALRVKSTSEETCLAIILEEVAKVPKCTECTTKTRNRHKKKWNEEEEQRIVTHAIFHKNIPPLLSHFPSLLLFLFFSHHSACQAVVYAFSPTNVPMFESLSEKKNSSSSSSSPSTTWKMPSREKEWQATLFILRPFQWSFLLSFSVSLYPIEHSKNIQ